MLAMALQKKRLKSNFGYDLPIDKSAVIAIIGPYGVGKSCFVKNKFSEYSSITVHSLDKLNELLKSSSSRPQDHHFEAMLLTYDLLKKLASIPAVLTESASIDEFRFDRLIDRDYATRDYLVIEEIAPKNVSESANRFIEREGTSQLVESRVSVAKTGAEDALRFRAGRIKKAVANPKIQYKLYCSQTGVDGKPLFELIAQKQQTELLLKNSETFGLLVLEL